MFLPTTRSEMLSRSWDACDVVLVTPDAYVDHPSFAMAVLSRFLEYHEYRVGILPQPRWKDPMSFLALGTPRIAFVVSGGNMDSMVLNYTASRKPRNEDQFCENGNPFFSKPGDAKKYRIRPDRVVAVYSNQIRSVCRGVPIIIGGIEASLRRIAHYDYWSDSVRRSILFDAKADLLIYGMGEYPLFEVIEGIREGIFPHDMEVKNTAVIRHTLDGLGGTLNLPSYDQVKTDRDAFAEAFCAFSMNFDRKILTQQHDTRFLVQYPRRKISQRELDLVYELPYERRPHPRYHHIPAFTMIRNSITAHRGCYGACSFCAVSAHQGHEILSRSLNSVLQEARTIAEMEDFSGTISDVGGPSANMYGSICRIGGCDSPECLRRGSGCPNLIAGTEKYLAVLKAITGIPGVRHVLVSSGLRFDPVLMDERFLEEMLFHYISGQLKIGVESGNDRVLSAMNKPGTSFFSDFKKIFDRITSQNKIRKFINPYIIVGHPGEGEPELDDTLRFLKKHNLRGHQFQIFTPTPLTRSSAMYYLGFDPCTHEPINVERQIKILEKRKHLLLKRGDS